MAMISAIPDGWKTILIVDDDPFLTDYVSLLLRHASYRTMIANDARAGLTAAKKYAPDGILLDLAMPDVDGFAFLECKRVMADIADIPVIVLSAAHRDQDVQRALKFGARGYVAKPVDDIVLLTRLERLVPSPLYGRRPSTRVTWHATGARTLLR